MTVTVIIVISLLTKPIPINELDGLTWATLKNKETVESKEQEGNSAASATFKGKDMKYLTHTVRTALNQVLRNVV